MEVEVYVAEPVGVLVEVLVGVAIGEPGVFVKVGVLLFVDVIVMVFVEVYVGEPVGVLVEVGV